VELEQTVRYKPYRIQRIRPLQTPPCDNVAVDALIAKMRELLVERIELGLAFPLPMVSLDHSDNNPAPPSSSPQEMMHYLDSFTSLDQAWTWFPAPCCRARWSVKPFWKPWTWKPFAAAHLFFAG